MVIIYNVAGGDAKTLDMVDAIEHVASGRWVFTPPMLAVNPYLPVEYADRLAKVTAAKPTDAAEAKLAELDAAMKPKAKK